MTDSGQDAGSDLEQPFTLTTFPSTFASGSAQCVMLCDRRRPQSRSLMRLILDPDRLNWVHAQPYPFVAILIHTDSTIALMVSLEDEDAVIRARANILACEITGGSPTNITLELDPRLLTQVAVSSYCHSGGAA
jgi:hypothetical protein